MSLKTNNIAPNPLLGPGFIKRIEEARANRVIQLKKWEEYDNKMSQNESSSRSLTRRKNKCGVEFPNSCVLLDATLRDDYDEVARLLKQGVDPNAPKDDGLTPLHQACINDNIQLCELLIAYGADVNARDADHWTPLHAAANCGALDMCRFLISKGADLLAINVDGSTPYDIAETDEISLLFHSEFTNRKITANDLENARTAPERAMIEELKQMYKRGEDVNTLDSQGAAPIHIAAACGYQDAAEVLMKMGVPPDTLDADKWTPAQVAVCWGQVEVLEVLVAYGADLNLCTPSGQTAFTLCEQDEMHERVMEIWSNREQLRAAANSASKLVSSRPLTRRQSSSSVHRSSMREKSDLSKRAVMQEAQLATVTGNIEDLEDVSSPMNNDRYFPSPSKPTESSKLVRNAANGLDPSDTDDVSSSARSGTTNKNKFKERTIIVRPPTAYEMQPSSPTKDRSQNLKDGYSESNTSVSKSLSNSTSSHNANIRSPNATGKRIITIADRRGDIGGSDGTKKHVAEDELKQAEKQSNQPGVQDILAPKASEQSIQSAVTSEPVTEQTTDSSSLGGCCRNCTIL